MVFEECAICRESTLNGNEMPMFKCTHLYCSACSSKLAERIQYFNACKGPCPLCRATPLWSFCHADYLYISKQIFQLHIAPSSTIEDIQTNPKTPTLIADLLNLNPDIIDLQPGYEVAILSFQMWTIKQWLIHLKIDVDYPELVDRAHRVINKELRSFAKIVYAKLIRAVQTHGMAWLKFRNMRDNILKTTCQHKPTPTFATFAEMSIYVQTKYIYGTTTTTRHSKYHNDAVALFSAKWLLNPEEYETYQNACEMLYNAPWKPVFGRDVIDLDRLRYEDINIITAYFHHSVLHKPLIAKCRAIHAGTNVKPPSPSPSYK